MRSDRRRRWWWLGTVGAVAVLASGCHAATNELNPGREELKVAAKGSLGPTIADDEGRTLYLFEKDEPGESYCHGACESVWPPATTSAMPTIEAPLDAAKVSLLTREDGLMQVAYAGHPLYYYQGDTDADDTHGQEKNQFGAQWYALTAAGEKAEAHEGGENDGS
jgi:predicted lipoprotein with Yx(FWY)xxD motif